MRDLKQKLYIHRYFIAVSLIWLIYAALSLMAPATRAINQYRINLTQISLLRISILLPLLVIWLATIFAAARFHYYSTLVEGSPESSGFKKLARGVGFLFLVLITPAFINVIANYYPDSAAVEKWATIIRVYITITFYLLAFWHLFQSSRELNKTLSVARAPLQSRRQIAAGAVGVLSLLYAWAIFHNQFRTVSDDPLIKPTYFLGDWLIVSTIFLPYIVIWLWGLWSIINFRSAAEQVSGVFYRKAFLSLTRGLTAIVLMLIGLQFLTQSTTVFGHGSLGVVLIIVYILIFAIAVGYLFLARSARQLTSIEEA